MDIWLKKFIWNKLVASFILIFLIMFAKLRKLLKIRNKAPRAWFHCFNSFLLSYGFAYNTADPSMFVYRTSPHTLGLLLYVDDIILNSSSSFLLHTFISLLSNQFAMKGLGDLFYFLSIQVVLTSSGLFLSQQKYVLTLFHKFHLHIAKLVTTLSAAQTILSSLMLNCLLTPLNTEVW